jgi:hypothetical protein
VTRRRRLLTRLSLSLYKRLRLVFDPKLLLSVSTRSVQQAREGLPEELGGGGLGGEEVRDVLCDPLRCLEARFLLNLRRDGSGS